jgi:hypothetical protein
MLTAGVAGFRVGMTHGVGNITHLTLAPCGLTVPPAPIALPLGDLLRKTGGHGVGLGPFRHDGLDRPVTVRFVAEDTAPAFVAGPDEDQVLLPLPAADADMPEEIRMECRYGQIARVQYRRDGVPSDYELQPHAARLGPTD